MKNAWTSKRPTKPASGITYLASPYSHPSREVVAGRYVRACDAAGRLMVKGYVVFSPIAHSHSIERQMGRVNTGDFWHTQDEPILRLCSRLVVLMLDGWRESRGIAWEIEVAKEMGIPIEYMEIDSISRTV